jgi:hypothetical protein
MDPNLINGLIRKGAVPSDAYRNALLENVSIASFQTGDVGDDEQGGFVANLVFPTIAGDTTGKYYEIDTDSIAQDKAAERAPGTESEEGTWDLSQKEFGCRQYGYKEKIPEEMLKSTQSAAKADVVSQRSVDEVMLINSEVRFASAYWKTGVWFRDLAGAGSDVADVSYIYWSTYATSKPVKNILAERLKMKLAGKRKPNTLVLGAEVEPYLLEHPDIIGKLNNGQTPGGAAMASLQDLAKVFKVKRVIVADAVYNTSKSATPSNSFILSSKSAWLGYVNPTPTIMKPSAGYRFADRQISGNDMGVRSWKYWWQPNRSWYVEGAVDEDFKLVSKKHGIFFDGIVQ